MSTPVSTGDNGNKRGIFSHFLLGGGMPPAASSSSPPPLRTHHVRVPTAELSEQMQRMIDMQYEQQRLIQLEREQQLEQERETATQQQQRAQAQPQGRSDRIASIYFVTEDRNANSSADPDDNSNATHNLQRLSSWALPKTPYPSVRLSQADIDDRSSLIRQAAAADQQLLAAVSSNTPASTSPMTTTGNTTGGSAPASDSDVQLSFRDPTVGCGTLLFRDDKPLVCHESGLPRSPEQQPPPSSLPLLAASGRFPTPKATNASLLPSPPTAIAASLSAPPSDTARPLLLGRAPASVSQHLHLAGAASYGSVEGAAESTHKNWSSTRAEGDEGGVSTTTTTTDPPVPPTEGLPLFQHPRSAPLGGISVDAAPLPPPPSDEQTQPPSWHEHDFYYGNTDYAHYHHSYQGRGGNPRAASSARQSRQCTCCCCFTVPLRRCGRAAKSLFAALRHAEHVHRSVCYGAIDGMLTGSGLVGTFCGLGLVSESSPPQVHALVLAFSLCACASDALGMALGHVWTAHAVSVSQSRDRAAARQHFHRFKADAKGRLVDLLLQRGMLKIDAMSLADTLEGYPDLFVAALAGEGIVGGGGDGPAGGGESGDGTSCLGEALPLSGAGADYPHDPSYYSRPHYFSASPRRRPSSSGAAASYGRLSDLEMDPDAYAVAQATREARHESLGMVVSFTLFAVLPAWILGMAWEWSNSSGSGDAAQHQRGLFAGVASSASTAHMSSSSSALDLHPAATAAPFLSPASLALTIGACVMWVLGIWKSRFFVVPSEAGGRGTTAPHWAWFGTEAVAVFGLCVASAYGLGALLWHTGWSDRAAIVLQAASPGFGAAASHRVGGGIGSGAAHDDLF